MFGVCEVVAIKPTHPGQGDFVHINKADFDPAKGHELYEPDAKRLGIAELRAALTDKGISFPDGAKKADLQALLDAA